MGIYTEKFRELTNSLPKEPKDFQGPEFASMIVAQLSNAALQIIASLEETLDDEIKAKEKVEEMLMEKMDGWHWQTPRPEENA